MKVVIIEDEVETAWDIQNCLKTLRPHFQVAATLDSVETACEWFAQNRDPDLIICDIQLGDGLSFDIFKHVEIRCPVIFCTAFNQYAMHAFQSNGVDYLLKPISEKLFEKSLLKLETMASHFPGRTDFEKIAAALYSNFKPADAYKTSFLVPYRDQLIPVHIHDIVLFKHHDGATEVITTRTPQRYSMHKTLDAIESLLDPKLFFRANRQYIVAFDAVRQIEHYEDRKLLIKLKTDIDEPVVVSKARASDFLKWMENR